MTDRAKRGRGLGRGLSALMADMDVTEESVAAPSTRHIAVDLLDPNPDQPRKSFTEAALDDLAASIRAKGVLQPLIVRRSPHHEGRYEIVAGERRWRAAQRAPVHEVPVVVRDLDDLEVLEIAIIENVQRTDLNAVEEARGYRQLIDRFGHTQEQLAQSLGKSRSHIANLMRLLQLPDEVLDMLRDEQLSAGHARALIPCDDPVRLARIVVERGLSVRETERLAKDKAPAAPRSAPRPDADTKALEQELSAQLRMPVRLRHLEDGGGEMLIRYRTLDDLERLCRQLGEDLPAGSI